MRARKQFRVVQHYCFVPHSFDQLQITIKPEHDSHPGTRRLYECIPWQPEEQTTISNVWVAFFPPFLISLCQMNYGIHRDRPRPHAPIGVTSPLSLFLTFGVVSRVNWREELSITETHHYDAFFVASSPNDRSVNTNMDDDLIRKICIGTEKIFLSFEIYLSPSFLD